MLSNRVKFAKKSENRHIFAKYLANNLEYSQIDSIFAVQKQKNNKQITITIMEKTYPTIKGRDLEWHTDPNDLPPYSIHEHIIVAYAYRKTPSTESYADRVCFDVGDLYIGDKEHTYQIAWAVFDTDIPKDVLNKIIADRKKYQEDHADEIKAKRIAELEALLAELKK